VFTDDRRHVLRGREEPGSGDGLRLSWLVGAFVAIGALLIAAPELGFRSRLGDLLGSAAMLALAIGAVLEYERVRNRERVRAAQEERRRLARDLHDGVAQELAFIVGQSRRLALTFPDERALADIGSAAASALDGSRWTIDGLRQGGAHTLGGAVEHRARMLAARAGLEIEVDVTGGMVPSAELEHCILSIVHEAISNAARHAGASKLVVSMSAQNGIVELRVCDDGCGFDPARPQISQDGGGFGLLSMSERASELSGVLKIASSPGQGTTIEVTIPTRARGRPQRARAGIAA